MLPAERDLTKTLLCFYDSGYNLAGISDRAYELLMCETIRAGPTVLGVAGSKTIMVPHGEECFYLKLADTAAERSRKPLSRGYEPLM